MHDQRHPANPNARLHPWPPQSGEWVRFKTKDPLPAHAHVCPEGYYVGIYVRQGTDSQGNAIGEHVAPVDQHGENLFSLPRVVVGSLDGVPAELRGAYDSQGDTHTLKAAFTHITLDPASLIDLHHAEEIDHLPEHRIAKTLAADPEHRLPAWHRRRNAGG